MIFVLLCVCRYSTGSGCKFQPSLMVSLVFTALAVLIGSDPLVPHLIASLGLGGGLHCSSGLKTFSRLLKVRSMHSCDVSPGVLYNFVELLS